MKQETISFNGYHDELHDLLKTLIDNGYHIDAVIRTSDLTIGFNTYLIIITPPIEDV